MNAWTRLTTVVMGWITRPLAADAAQSQRAEALEAQLRMLNDIALDYSLVTLDAQGLVLTWNRGAQRVEGHAPEQIIGRPWEDLFPDEDRAHGMAAWTWCATRSSASTAASN